MPIQYVPRRVVLSEERTHVPGKVLINLATGMEDAERVMIALLVATAAVEQRQGRRDLGDEGRGASGAAR